MERSGIDAPLSGHAEMKDQSVTAIGFDEAELAATPKTDHHRTGEPLAEVGREGSAQVLPAKLDPIDPSPEKNLLEAANSGFDFGKFGHRGHMANVGAAS